MNDLNCKKCDTPAGNYDDDVKAVTCSMCSMADVFSMFEEIDCSIVGEA